MEGAYEGKFVGAEATGDEYRPYDFSITKNAFSVMISGLITMLIVFSLVRFYKRKKFKAPRKGMGGLEMIVEMLYKEVIVCVLGKESKRYAHYLLTLFFFIFVIYDPCCHLLFLLFVCHDFPRKACLIVNVYVCVNLSRIASIFF